jgi:DNA-binding Xre family transcriptional regulator
MIRWNLVEIMEDRGISSVALAKELGLSKNAVFVYRKGHPRITGDALDRLLNALNRLRRHNTAAVRIEDLIEYTES